MITTDLAMAGHSPYYWIGVSGLYHCQKPIQVKFEDVILIHIISYCCIRGLTVQLECFDFSVQNCIPQKYMAANHFQINYINSKLLSDHSLGKH